MPAGWKMTPGSSLQPEDGNSYSSPCRYQHGKSESRIVSSSLFQSSRTFGDLHASGSGLATWMAAPPYLQRMQLQFSCWCTVYSPLDHPLSAPFSSFHSWHTFHMDEQWARESNRTKILGWTGAVHSLALICVGLRMYARLRILRTPGRDDAAIVVASVCLV